MSNNNQQNNNSTPKKKIDEIAKKIKETEEKVGGPKAKMHIAKHDEEEFRFSPIDSIFGQLYINEPFLGTVAAGITKVMDQKMPTAYVGCRANGNSHEIILGYNPKFMMLWNKEQQMGVVKHELYHVVLQHIFSRMVGDKSQNMLHNWATDLAINSLIGEKNLPNLVLIPGKRPIDPKTGEETFNPYSDYVATAPLGESSDYYFEQLRKIQDEIGDDDGEIALGSGIGTLDDHGEWQNLPDEVRDQIEDKVRDLIEKGAKRAEQQNSWGSCPAEISEYIKNMLSRQVDWRSILKSFIGRSRTMERNSTIRKINKKMPYVHPGVKRPMKANFAAFIDQSGSMSDEDVALMFGELRNLANLTEIDVYHFDTEVDEQSHMKWKKTDANPKCLRTRHGGTEFNSVVDFCNRNDNRGRWSGVIILTDGYAPKCGQILNAKVIWVITENGTVDSARTGDLVVQMSREQVNAKPKPY